MTGPSRRFLIVGCGKMGEAILGGWLASDAMPADVLGPGNFEVVAPREERRGYLAERYGVPCKADVVEVSDRFDVVVLAVKPQVMMDVLDVMATNPAFSGGGKGPLFVSIAAGLTTASLGAALPEGAPVVRVMPNMPLSVRAGASGVCGGEHARSDQVDYVTSLFGCLGRAVRVPERDMDAVCAVSGSGPAYVAAMIESLRDAAAAHGLDAGLAETLALQTVLGTARLIDETGISPAAARESICSPGGTTLAALDAMGDAGFDGALKAGVDAAIARSKELAGCI